MKYHSDGSSKQEEGVIAEKPDAEEMVAVTVEVDGSG